MFDIKYLFYVTHNIIPAKDSVAGILIVYIRVIISWEITCVIFNLCGTSASVAFYDALDVELDISQKL